ncbi:MAG TPA: hypothetical protein VML54_05940 [Candidatus Limnocylindrales bacterium]|nr:hypothetical protein [Candidatus Limnocylindrales bacterium]
MSVSVLVVRPHQSKVHGVASVVELAKVCEFPCVPAHGNGLVFADGTPPAVVSFVQLEAAHGGTLGVQPPRVLVRCKTEPGSGLEACLAAGWTRLDPPSPPGTPER